MLRAHTEVCAEAIMAPLILAEQFELKHSLINMMTSEQFFGLEKDNPHDHIRVARRWLEKEPPRSITTWDDLVSKFINEFSPPLRTTNLRNEISNFQQKFNESFHEAWERFKDLLRACPHHSFTELHQLDTFYNALNPADQDSLNATTGGNLLEKSPQDALTIIKNKSKVRSSRSKPIASPIDMVKNELRNEMKTFIQTSLSNQTNEIKNMMASLLKMNTASTLGSRSLSGNTVANPKGKIKAITTCSGLVIDGPTVPTPPKFVTPEEDERVEDTYTDLDLAKYTIKVPPPPVQKHKPPFQRNFVKHTRDSPLPNILYPSRMLKQKQQEKDEIQIQKFWHMFKQLHLNITLAEALVLMPNQLKCKALANLGASINLMPLYVWRKLGLPDLILTRMTLELANRVICTPNGITRDVFVPVGKFTFLADFVVVDYETDPRVPLILGRPFLRTAHALIDVHGEEMILRNDDERLTLNMKHDTTSYSNHPHRESVNLINIFNVSSEDYLEVSVSNQTSGNPTFSLHKEITSLKVTHEFHDSEGCNLLSEELPDIDSFNDIHPYFDDNPLSGRTTYSSNSEIEFLLYQGKDSGLKDSIDQMDLTSLDAYFVDPTPKMFTDEHAPDYSSPPRFDVYDDDFLEVESDADNFYDDPFDSKAEKIKESKLLIDELDLLCDFLPYSEYDSFASQDFSRDNVLPSPDNEDKIFNP
nr:hypothetical protein [Tanacetum cinerariifolium]